MMQITLEAAQKASSRILELALGDGKNPVCFCIVDDSGCLLSLARMDGAPRRLAAIAVGKAYTAARMGCSTADFQKRLRDENLNLADFCDSGLTSLPGGMPVLIQGRCRGAVAVSGRKLAEDHELAVIFAQYLLGCQ